MIGGDREAWDLFLQWASSRLHIPHAASGVGHLGGVLPASLDESPSV